MGRALQLLLLLIPFALAIFVTLALSEGLGVPTTRGGQIGKTLLLIVVSAVVMLATDRVAKLAAPVPLLLRITMVFPDQAPSRVRVAMRCSSEEELRRTLRQVNDGGLGDNANEAAETLMVLVAALSRHDRMTKGHSERTRAYADVIAGELGLSTEDRSKLRWAALLHDVGKMQIPEEILNKPGRLTDTEYEIVKQHPSIGADLVEPLREFLGPWADTVVQHHERWDGGGYPNGIRSEEICLGARIVAVADTFDVITSLRSYKKAQSANSAREEIARHAGTQFDPDVVKAFLGISIGRFGWRLAPLSVLTQIPQLVALMSPVAGGVTTVATAAPAVVVAAGTVGGLAATTDVFAADLPEDLPFEAIEVMDDSSESAGSEGTTTLAVPGTSIVVTVDTSGEPEATTTSTTTSTESTSTPDALDGSTTTARPQPSTTAAPRNTLSTRPSPAPSSTTPTTAAPTTAAPTTAAPTTAAPTTLAPIVPQAPNGQLPEVFGTCLGERGITAAEARAASTLEFGECDLSADGPLDLSGFNLAGIAVDGGTWTGTIFTGANIDGATFRNVAIWQADFSEVNASGVEFYDFAMAGSTFEGATISNSTFHRGDLGATSFKNATLFKVLIGDASISKSDFSDATITQSDLSSVTAYQTVLDDASLSFVNLDGANLTEAVFDDAELVNVQIRTAQVWTTSWNDADLTNVMFDATVGDPDFGADGLFENVTCRDGTLATGRFCSFE